MLAEESLLLSLTKARLLRSAFRPLFAARLIFVYGLLHARGRCHRRVLVFHDRPSESNVLLCGVCRPDGGVHLSHAMRGNDMPFVPFPWLTLLVSSV